MGSGAGLEAANGKYTRVAGQLYDREPVFQLDGKHELYRYQGMWRIALQGQGLYYAAVAGKDLDGPPVAKAGFWETEEMGKDPPPTSIVCESAEEMEAGIDSSEIV